MKTRSAARKEREQREAPLSNHQTTRKASGPVFEFDDSKVTIFFQQEISRRNLTPSEASENVLYEPKA